MCPIVHKTSCLGPAPFLHTPMPTAAFGSATSVYSTGRKPPTVNGALCTYSTTAAARSEWLCNYAFSYLHWCHALCIFHESPHSCALCRGLRYEHLPKKSKGERGNPLAAGKVRTASTGGQSSARTHVHASHFAYILPTSFAKDCPRSSISGVNSNFPAIHFPRLAKVRMYTWVCVYIYTHIRKNRNKSEATRDKSTSLGLQSSHVQ